MLEKAFTEVNQVIKHMDKNDVEKISANFLKMIENNMDKSYNFIYDENKKVYEQDISKDARTIISIMYIKYLATEEEKQFYYGRILEDKKLDEKQFSSENMFKNKNSERYVKNSNETNNDVISVEKTQNLNIVKKETKLYKKIINWIKSFFK